MSYSSIDTVISDWAEENHLSVYTEYKDAEVRSVELVSPVGRRFQIWIDQPKNDQVAVHAWDYKTRRQDWCGSVGNLAEYLRSALSTVGSWSSS